jgi:2-keto-4-pentenoate hydratase/2-oxohepta-3-ene-1,7-dioic acid hydratase in catechol pathway
MQLASLHHRDSGERVLTFATDESTFHSVPAAAKATGLVLDPAIIDPMGLTWLTSQALEHLAELNLRLDTSALEPLDLNHWRLTEPVPKPGKIIAVGRNYMDHVREGQRIWAKRGRKISIPEFPSAFAKFATSLCGPRDDIIIPAGISNIDYEIELAVIIGTPALDVAEDQALSHVAGYSICNDFAARDIQRREMEAQIGITLSKNFPTFAPMGPWFTSADSIGDPQTLQLTLEVDGEVRQDANTSDMIFSVARLVSYWSRVGLETGDILITGTPSGVALARENPQAFFLRPGQLVVARIEKLGELRNRMR